MKKILLTLSVALLSATISFSQISILFSDMPQVGDTISRNADTITTLTPGPAGANQSWVMTNATVHVTEITKAMAPSSTPYASSYTNSNIALTNDNQSFLYFNQNNSSSVIKGAAGNLLQNGCNINMPFSPDLLLHNFPRNYGSNFSDGYGIDVTLDGSCVGQSTVDDVRFKRVSTVYDTTDGWGTITTPVGTYECLRVKRVDFSTDSTWVKPFFPATWTFVSTKKDTSYSYLWLAKEGKLAIAELSFDSLDNPKKFTWSLIPPFNSVTANFIANKIQGCVPLVNIQFTDLSTGNPTSWQWIFENNGQSTLQNPTINYSNPGVYDVTLIVGNGNVFDTIVKPDYIRVFANPIADFAVFDSSGSVPLTVDFQDLSLAGDTAIISWNWDFGDGDSSSLQNPIHVYSNAGNYTVTLIAGDANGCVSAIVKNNAVSVTVGIESQNPNPGISFFSNPTSGKIYFSGIYENLSLVIFDVAGKRIQKFEVSQNNSSLDISNLPSGIYFCKFENREEKFFNGKFIVRNQ